jgi:carboxypeptidase Taq
MPATAQPAPQPAAAAVPDSFARLRDALREAETVASIGHLLNWDQETYMPPAGAAHRAEQAALVSALAHEKATSPRVGELIAACEADRDVSADPASPWARGVREARRDYDLHTRLPTDLVAELARVGSQAQEAWKHARERSDFPAFRPWLERMMELTRRKAERLRTPGQTELYDALLNEYEPGATAREIQGVFDPLGERLSLLLRELGASGKRPSDAPVRVQIDPARQHELGLFVLRAIGFDFEAGRLDTTTHPFCSGMAPGDTRLTTRYRESSWTDALYSSLHEAGHGLYEQGLPKTPALYGTPLAQSISLGIHESQSRMWENFVGRSLAFWRWLTPHARRITAAGGSSPLEGVSAESVYAAVNTAQPSLIRVEADEATYNLHVMVRFRLERALFAGELKVADLPGEWNGLYRKYLGVSVPDDKHGVLQDVHWSFGLIGYFPTYTLGNLYCAQLWETIQKQVPGLDESMARGDFAGLKRWLNANVHAHGRRYRAGELCEMLTGRPLSADPLMRHLETKLRPLYR